MKKILFTLIFLFSTIGIGYAQQGFFIRENCDELTPINFKTFCSHTGESTETLIQGKIHRYDDTWIVVGDSSTVPTRQEVFDSGKDITGANSLANAERTGDATNQWCRYRDSALGLMSVPCTAADIRQWIQTDKTGGWSSEEHTGDGETIDPDAGSKYDMYQYADSMRPVVSAQVPLRPAGDCSVAEEAIITNDPLAEWITCADTTGDTVAFDFFVPGKMRTITSITITMIAVNKNATPTGTYTLACAAQFVRPGTDAYAAHNTTGQQNVSFTTFDTQYRPEEASATITVNGTAAKNAHVKGQCNVSAVPGQIADIRLAGAVIIEALAKSRSD